MIFSSILSEQRILLLLLLLLLYNQFCTILNLRGHNKCHAQN